MPTPEKITEGIRITAKTKFVPEQSDPARGRYLYSYEITIENLGAQPAQLLTRHWIITDAMGRVEEVRGEGVVGETPYLEPGESFSYTSFCPLPSEYGTMEGTYGMVRPDGAKFDAEIPVFPLGEPYSVN